jgi:hypothetical protein
MDRSGCRYSAAGRTSAAENPAVTTDSFDGAPTPLRHVGGRRPNHHRDDRRQRACSHIDATQYASLDCCVVAGVCSRKNCAISAPTACRLPSSKCPPDSIARKCTPGMRTAASCAFANAPQRSSLAWKMSAGIAISSNGYPRFRSGFDTAISLMIPSARRLPGRINRSVA